MQDVIGRANGIEYRSDKTSTTASGPRGTFTSAPRAGAPDDELAAIQTNIATLSRQTLALQQSDESLTAALNEVDRKHDQAIAELRSDVNRQDALDSDLAGRVKAIEARIGSLEADPPEGDSLAGRLTSRVFLFSLFAGVAVLAAGFTHAMGWPDVFNKLLIAGGIFSGVEGARDVAGLLSKKE